MLPQLLRQFVALPALRRGRRGSWFAVLESTSARFARRDRVNGVQDVNLKDVERVKDARWKTFR